MPNFDPHLVPEPRWMIAQSRESYWSMTRRLGYDDKKNNAQFMAAFNALQGANGGADLWPGMYVIVPANMPVDLPTEPGWDERLLVPPDGKLYLGTTQGTGMGAYTAITGQMPTIFHEYATIPSQIQADLTKRVPPGVIWFQNFKPAGYMGRAAYEAILRGDADDALRAAAVIFKSASNKLMIAFNHEPENDDKTGDSDAIYADSFRYCVEFLRNEGVGFVSVWNMMGWRDWWPRYDTLYPGDDVVDWIVYDPYCHLDTDLWATWINRTAKDWPGFYTWAAEKGKPIMLGEWGIDNKNGKPSAAKLLTQNGVDELLTDFPLLKALVYWDQIGDAGDYRLVNHADDYARFANLPAFQL